MSESKEASVPEGKYVGQPVLRVEDGPLLRGRGQFIDDLPEKPTTLHAAILRSPHAHAEIVAIDATEALALSGVHAVITGQDVKPLTAPLIVGFKNEMDYRGIALDRVRYVGEPVAIACATDRYKAEDALDLIKVTYKALPAVVDPVEAASDDAPVLHPAQGSNVVSRRVFTHGAPDAAFASAPRTAKIAIRYPRNALTPMETYAIVAEYMEDSAMYDVISNFQGPFSLHTVMALGLKTATGKLRHRSPVNSGGSFGSKLTIFPYVVLMCVAARLTGRPVKWIEDRLEHLSAANSAPNRVTTLEAAFDDDGIVSGFRFENWDDHGAYLRAPMPAPIYRMHGLSTNGYAIPNLEVTNHIMVTNKCPSGAVRGFGGPQLYFAIERMMQKIALTLGLDPLDVIRRNLIPAGSFPYRTVAGALFDSGDYQKTIEETVAGGGLDELKRRREEARARGRLYGIGYATAVEPSQSNMGYISTLKTGKEREEAGPKDGAVASAQVMVDALGSVTVVGDSVPQGQGHQTTLAQIVADQLGLRPKDITVNLETDTHKDGWSIAAGNYACRFAPASASAVHVAAVRVRDKLARIASQNLNVPPEDVEFKDGMIRARDNPENALPFYRVGGLAHWSPLSLPEGMESGVREAVSWNAPELTPTNANDEINTSLAYGFIFDFCGVEIDRDTGEVRIDHYATAHDCGTILNPGLAHGQIHGSFAAAIGATFFEEFVYGEDGSFLTGTYADYLVPTAPEMPELRLIEPTAHPSPFTRLGAKGIAEGNQFTTPVCIANAVADALGREDITIPLAPSKVAGWIHGAEAPPPSGTPSLAEPSAKKGRALSGGGDTFVPVAPAEVWRMLLDPDSLARVIPGCHALEQTGENAYQAVVDAGVGPIRGRFEANVRLSDLVAEESLALSGEMLGPLGSSSGTGTVTLAPKENGTAVSYRYEVHVAGKVAAVGGRMLDGAARIVIGQFFEALIRQAGGGDGAPREGWWRRLLRAIGLVP